MENKRVLSGNGSSLEVPQPCQRLESLPDVEQEISELRRVVLSVQTHTRLLRTALLMMGGLCVLLASRSAVPSESGTTLHAPVRILGPEGRLLMLVDTGTPERDMQTKLDEAGPRLQMFDEAGRPLVLLVAAKSGGYVAAKSRHAARSNPSASFRLPERTWVGSAVLHADDDGGGLRMTDGHAGIFTAIECGTDTRGMRIFARNRAGQSVPALDLLASDSHASVRAMNPRADWHRVAPFAFAEMGVNPQGARLYLTDRWGKLKSSRRW